MDLPTAQPPVAGGTIVPSLSTRSAADALANVTSWREQANAKHRREVEEVEDELKRLATAIEDLQRQQTALGDFRNELVSREATIEAEEQQRAHDSLLEAITTQSEELATRAAIALEADKTRATAIEAALQESEVASAWKEYREFIDNQDNIANLPASYRTALAMHHEATAAKLADAVRNADPGPTKLDETPLSLDILFTIAPGEAGENDLASVILPVADVAWTDWDSRQDDLQLLVAARVAQALYEAAHALGHITAHSMQGGHRGLLAIELDLAKVDRTEARDKIAEHLASVGKDAPELVAANIAFNAIHVPMGYLLPPEDGGTEEVLRDR